MDGRKGYFAAIVIAALSGCIANQQLQTAQAREVLRNDKGVTVYAAGDVADCKGGRPERSGAAKTAALIEAGLAADPAARVLMLGDATYPVGTLAEFTGCYEPTWGRFKQSTLPAPGNHEYYTPQAVGYYTYFGDIAGPERRGYYSFDLGPWHVISLNSYLKPEPYRAQLEWLARDLAQHKTRCTLAYFHHPRFSSGGHGDNPQIDDMWRMLAQAGVDLVLAAHDHNYERLAPKNADGNRDDAAGMRSFVIGTGGAKLTLLRFRGLDSEVVDNSTHGVLKLALKQQGYEWEFLPVKKDGFTDSGAGLCH
ncbi:metallophosphoesterase family protein [Noviherbaspirillum galbum]|uniref:metallophosphoesterase family protein n=1 Tax=Noviherbaspirillum galbum TaxID=2709383 RepID=UPI001969D41D|nr:metallophosphoesterase [Noviherbaspirillum galbum]